MYSEILKETLRTQPDRQTVWLSDAGEWSFHKREGFETELSRDEILGETNTEEAEKAEAEKAEAEKAEAEKAEAEKASKAKPATKSK